MPHIAGIDHVQVAIPPGADEAARTFYGGVLGLTEIPKPAPLNASGGLWFQTGAGQLHIGGRQPGLPRAPPPRVRPAGRNSRRSRR